jgi:hypothetical protein
MNQKLDLNKSEARPHPGPLDEPSARSAAFTPLQLPMLRELCTLKRRKRRAPVQGFNARMNRERIAKNDKWHVYGSFSGSCAPMQ